MTLALDSAKQRGSAQAHTKLRFASVKDCKKSFDRYAASSLCVRRTTRTTTASETVSLQLLCASPVDLLPPKIVPPWRFTWSTAIFTHVTTHTTVTTSPTVHRHYIPIGPTVTHLPYCRHYTTLPYCILTCPTVTNLPVTTSTHTSYHTFTIYHNMVHSTSQWSSCQLSLTRWCKLHCSNHSEVHGRSAVEDVIGATSFLVCVVRFSS
jgi:hypothetical protein